MKIALAIKIIFPSQFIYSQGIAAEQLLITRAELDSLYSWVKIGSNRIQG